MEKLIKKNIRVLKPYIVDSDPINIKLDANENPYDIFGELKNDFYKRLEQLYLNRYPDTDSRDLCKAISKYMGVQPENILCGNGSDEVIQIIINTYIEKDDAVVIPNPTFSMYKIFSSIVGGKVIEVPSKEDFNVDVEEIIKQAIKNKAKIIFLCSPNNPTGNLVSRQSILKIINETSSIVVLDEAYGEFCDESNIDQIKNNRVIVLHTFSKAFGIAGSRLGYAIAHRDTIDILKRVKPPYNLNVFSQLIGLIILENQNIVKKAIYKIVKERNRVIEELRNIKDIEVFPSKTNFILIRSKKSQDVVEQSKKQSIAIRPFNEQSLKNCIRISIGSENENNEIIKVIKGVLISERS
jgi:histidinol-phosphate aminotransferase